MGKDLAQLNPQFGHYLSQDWWLSFQCIKINSSITAVHCFHDGYVGMQAVALENYSA